MSPEQKARHPDEKNVTPDEKNVTPDEKNVTPDLIRGPPSLGAIVTVVRILVSDQSMGQTKRPMQ